jgi:hypothetical protein
MLAPRSTWTLFRFRLAHHFIMMMVVVMMVMMDNHRAVLSHLVAAHLLASFFFRKGGDSEAERNDGRQGNRKLIHRFTPGDWLRSLDRYRCPNEPSVNGRYWPAAMPRATQDQVPSS